MVNRIAPLFIVLFLVISAGRLSAYEAPTLCAPCVRADMEFLASDELHGRGSATRDEHLAALYLASQLESFGLEPGGDNGSFLQKAPLPNPLPERLQKHLTQFEATPRTETWNVVGILRGHDAKTQGEAILLTAHLDHLGMGSKAVNGDAIYNGADDDASGTTAVVELARALASQKAPKRTVIFVLFGAEEFGGVGSQYFVDHPPMPIEKIVANLEFEMIGRPDAAVAPGHFWLTGFERSDLGPELIKHGALLAADPHPKEQFFMRSDNFGLAKRGIIAQTVSSFGLHTDYHQPSDDLAHIDFAYLTRGIESMIGPVRWLANTDWKPKWNAGGRPQ